MHRLALFLSLFLPVIASAAESTHRLHDGVTAFVNNPEGRDFQVALDVRDINIYENGPREVLCKIYDPDGKPVVREVIPDDGVISKAFLPPMGAWDHEAWYYAYNYMKGTQPMIRWSAFSQPDRLGAVAKRTFKYPVKGTKKGIYRVLLVGCIDHYVTLKIDPDLPYAVGGHPDWIHGHGDQWRKSYVYLPKETKGLYVFMAEYDYPQTRKLKISNAAGNVLLETSAVGGYSFAKDLVNFEGPMDEQILTVEVSAGPGDFLLGIKLRFPKDPEVIQRGDRTVTAVLAPDAATAKAVQNGAIYHDGRVFWQPFQVRLHEWLKKLPPEAFEVKTADGKVSTPMPAIGPKKEEGFLLATRPGYIVLNGPHMAPTPCDRILHHYPAHKNKGALNLAIKNLIGGLRTIGPNDHIAIAGGGGSNGACFSNLAYEFSNYAWHYWRAAWRLQKETDAPEELKAIVHEAFLVCGDRLAFCRTWERVNGNSFSLLLTALRYCQEATGDPLQKQMFDVYWDRFANGGWGDRVGVGPSGPIQEGFAYAYHYASYMLTSWKSILNDIPDERFQKVYDRARTWFSYTLGEGGVPVGPWSSRTAYYPQWAPEKEGPFEWKGNPGPDFTVDVNDGHEFFAARRKNYYALTFHGRLSPKWESNAHAGQSGYGGGMLCQLQVPGQGLVIASTLNGSYGEKMDISLWPTFHLHTTVGKTVDGTPLVTGDSEHPDAKLTGTKVTSSGEVRHNAVKIERAFTFENDGIVCEVRLKDTGYSPLLNLWVRNEARGKVQEAYEMIPYLAKQKPRPKVKGGDTLVQIEKAPGTLVDVTKDAAEAKAVVIDRGGFGVRIEFEEPRKVSLGQNSTLMIHLVDGPTPAEKVGMRYRFVPFGN